VGLPKEGGRKGKGPHEVVGGVKCLCSRKKKAHGFEARERRNRKFGRRKGGKGEASQLKGRREKRWGDGKSHIKREDVGKREEVALRRSSSGFSRSMKKVEERRKGREQKGGCLEKGELMDLRSRERGSKNRGKSGRGMLGGERKTRFIGLGRT